MSNYNKDKNISEFNINNFNNLECDWKIFIKEYKDFLIKNYPTYLLNPEESLSAIFAISKNNRITEREKVQAIASKIRGFLYPIFGGREKKDDFVGLLKQIESYYSEYRKKNNKKINKTDLLILLDIYSKINDLDHYCLRPQANDFIKNKTACNNYSVKEIIKDFEKIRNLFGVIRNIAITIHDCIDFIINKVSNGKPSTKKDSNILKSLFSLSFDARDYFFTKADKRWLEWLWENGFLDALKTQPDDTSKYSYRTPEINYIVKVAEKKPKFVVEEIILCDDLATTEEKFNPELIDRILRLCGELPAEYLPKIVKKMKGQNWVKLLSPFGHWGFEFKDIFESLLKAGDEETMLELADVVLSIKTREDFAKDSEYNKNPFYVRDFSYTKVFDYLQKISDKKSVLELLVRVINHITNLGNKERDHIFAKEDMFHMWSTDFFTDEYKSNDGHSSYRESVEDLMLFTKEIAKVVIESECPKGEEDVRKLYDDCIGLFDDKDAKLPDTKGTWQLRLYLLSLYPKAFKDEIKKSLFRLFEGGKLHGEVKTGAEYKHLLQDYIVVLSKDEQSEYVKLVKDAYTSEIETAKDDKNKKFFKYYGAQTLCLLGIESKDIFGLECKYVDTEIHPSVINYGARTVISQAPEELDFSNKTPSEITKELQIKWTPEKLKELDEQHGAFHNSIDADAVGEKLKEQIKLRFAEFVENAELFFAHDKMIAHYTYAFFRGVQEAIKSGAKVDMDAWKSLIDMFKNIVNSKLSDVNYDDYRGWLANWRSAHQEIADILQLLLNEEDENIALGDFASYSDDLFDIFEKLLTYPDPVPASEEPETAKSKSSSHEDDEMHVSDPYTMAINSVRGRTFQAFLMFVYQDGKRLEQENMEEKIDKNVKKLFADLVKQEDTRTMMFMYGHHLPTFYFRDIDWTRESILPVLFGGDKDKDLKLAATEGYLTQTLYREMFEDDEIRELYNNWIGLKDVEYSNGQLHWHDINEALAVHFALAFIHFDIEIDLEKGFSDELLQKFFVVRNKNNTVRFKEFTAFIGKLIVNKSPIDEDLLEKSKGKLLIFWGWYLNNKKIPDGESFSGFGFWINPDIEILPDEVVADKVAKTLEKSGGDIDWEHGLLKRLSQLADKNPEATLEIIRLYLLDDDGINKNRRLPIFGIEKDIKPALKIICSKGNLQNNVKDLVSTLIEKGGREFWKLRDVF